MGKIDRPKNLIIEGEHIAGALQLLDILRHDWAVEIAPCHLVKLKPKEGAMTDKAYFPVQKYRDKYGRALLDWLHDTNHMRRFLLQGVDGLTFVPKFDKKGKVAGFTITDE